MRDLLTISLTFLGYKAATRPDESAAWLEAQGGQLIEREGGAGIYAFGETQHALAAARELLRQDPACAIGAHAGQVIAEHMGLQNATVARCRQLLAALEPGELVITASVFDQIDADHWPQEAPLQELGEQRLGDLMRPERLYSLSQETSRTQIGIDNYPHNLPIQTSPLLGRERELNELLGLIDNADVRMVTLVGDSGAGKTRLAIQAAAERLARYADGVWFIACAPITNPDLLLSALGDVIGISENPDEPLIDTLAAALASKRTILIFDNVEQIASAAAHMAQLITKTQHLKIMATSQVRLGIAQETAFPVATLALPDMASAPAQIYSSPAVMLFLERARAINPLLELSNASLGDIAELCQLLNGLPLAIELAAAHSDSHTPQQMAFALSRRFEAVRDKPRLSSRERLLVPVLQWSYELLDPETQILFNRLGVFIGGATQQDAESVCFDRGRMVKDVLDGLALLLDRGLLLQEELKDGDLRYIMLDGIHEFARQMLIQSGESRRMIKRHLAYYTDVAEAAEPLLAGAEQSFWLHNLESQHHNMRAALQRGIQANETALVLRLAGALGRFWRMRSYFSEGQQWLESVLALSGGPDGPRSQCLAALGTLRLLQGRPNDAQAIYDKALAFRAKAPDPVHEASLHNNQGVVASMLGDYTRAREHFEASLAQLRHLNDPAQLANGLNNLGVLAFEQGDYGMAADYYQQSLELAETLGDETSIAISHINLGETALLGARYGAAADQLNAALQIALRLGDKLLEADARMHLAFLTLDTGDPAQAEALFNQVLTIREAIDDQRGSALTLEGLALAQARQQRPEARSVLERASAIRAAEGLERSILDQQRFHAVEQALGQPAA